MRDAREEKIIHNHRPSIATKGQSGPPTSFMNPVDSTQEPEDGDEDPD